MVVCHQLSVGAALHDLTVCDGENVVDLGEEVQSVGDENLGLTVGVIHKHLVEHRFPDMGIERGKGVLEVFRQQTAENGQKRHSRRRSGRRQHSR